MKKKVIAILMLTSLVCGSVMGCGSGKEETASNGEGASEEPVVLKWQSWDPASKYQPIIDAYQEANPNVTIEYEHQIMRRRLIQKLREMHCRIFFLAKWETHRCLQKKEFSTKLIWKL